MLNLILSREIYSPLERAYGYHAALESALEYWPNVVDCRKVRGSYGTAVAGDRYRWRYRLRGHEVSGVLDVDEAVAGERLVFHTSGGMHARFRWEYLATAHTRTRVTLRLSYEVHEGLVGRLLDRVRVEGEVTDDITAAMDGLRAVLEAGVVDQPPRVAPLSPEAELSGAAHSTVVLQVHTATGEIVYCGGPDAAGRCPSALGAGLVSCRGGEVAPLHGTLIDGWRIGVPDEPFTSCPLARVLEPAVS